MTIFKYQDIELPLILKGMNSPLLQSDIHWFLDNVVSLISGIHYAIS